MARGGGDGQVVEATCPGPRGLPARGAQCGAAVPPVPGVAGGGHGQGVAGAPEPHRALGVRPGVAPAEHPGGSETGDMVPRF